LKENTKNYKLFYNRNVSIGVDILDDFLDKLVLQDVVGVIGTPSRNVELQYVERNNVKDLNVKSFKMTCDKLLTVMIGNDYLFYEKDTIKGVIIPEFVDTISYKISNLIYENSIKPNFRLDLVESSDDLLEKLWLAAETNGDVMMPDVRNKWILPIDLAEKLFPIFTHTGIINNGCSGDIIKIGTYKGVDLYSSYQNTVALLCYKGYNNMDSGLIFAPYVIRTSDVLSCKKVELVYGMKEFSSSYYVSLQVR